VIGFQAFPAIITLKAKLTMALKAKNNIAA
jgi:hypothetical protein